MIDELLKVSVRKFILENEVADPFELTLKQKEVAGVPISLISQQISARQTAKKKFPAWYATEQLVYPSKLSLEQSSSQTTAEYKASLFKGESFVDLTGGMGVDAWAFSKSFQSGTYIEKQEQLSDLTKHNFDQLGLYKLEVANTTAEDFLAHSLGYYDLIYLDPARRNEHQQKVFRLEDCTPNVVELLPSLLSKGKKVLVKTSPMMDIELALQSLTNVIEIHIVSVENECKEVLYLIDKNSDNGVKTHCINFKKGREEHFSFLWKERVKPIGHYSDPQTYLYEPNASLMKAGAHGLLVEKYGLIKLHPNTHLYTSNQLELSFPGRIFEIKEVLPLSKKALKKVLSNNKANITVRNSRLDVAAIRKKTGIKPGGNDYLFACTLQDEELKVLVTNKV